MACWMRATPASLIGGLAVHYGTASSDVSSIFGDGLDRRDRLWHRRHADLVRHGGFYVDAQAQVTLV